MKTVGNHWKMIPWMGGIAESEVEQARWKC